MERIQNQRRCYKRKPQHRSGCVAAEKCLWKMKYNKRITSLYEHISSLEGVALIGCDEEGKTKQHISYKQLKEKIERAGSWLVKLGLKDRDVVGLAMSNSVELLVVSWAAWSLGIITAP